MQNLETMGFVLGCIGTLCWIVCFWWMHRISARQNSTLEELHQMTGRIEKLSRAEHDLITDVHPQVSEIKEKIETVREVVSSEKT
jgi:DNA replication initiation complex subunit (GINS family)